MFLKALINEFVGGQLKVAPEHLAQVLHALPRAGFVGLNVTIPHKQAALALADVVTDRAALIGAARS